MPPGRKPKYPKELIQQILALHNQKLSPSEIVKQLNLNIKAGKIGNLIDYYGKKLLTSLPLNINDSHKQNEIISGATTEGEKKN